MQVVGGSQYMGSTGLFYTVSHRAWQEGEVYKKMELELNHQTPKYKSKHPTVLPAAPNTLDRPDISPCWGTQHVMCQENLRVAPSLPPYPSEIISAH